MGEHDFLADFVSAEVFFGEFASIPSVKEALVKVSITLDLLVTDFIGDLFENLGFEILGFETDTGDRAGGVATGADC